MRPRPGTVERIVETGLPRPRTIEVREIPHFQECVHEITEIFLHRGVLTR